MNDKIVRLYRALQRVRRVEEAVVRLYPTDKIKSPVHLSLGQEPVAVGVIDALRPDDVVGATYRGHAAYVAKGGSLARMFAEMYGKADGCAGGKGGSMHLVDMSRGILGCSAVVGTHVPVAVGVALAMRRRGEDRVVVCFLGDGATEEGVFAESLNFASLHRLPVLFVCENNGFAIHTGLERRWATTQLTERVATYGIPVASIESGSVLDINEQAVRFVEHARSGAGPAFMECATFRWKEHVGPGEDFDAGYRSRETFVQWSKNDSVSILGTYLARAERDRIDHEIEAEITAAVAFAEQGSPPGPAALLEHVFAA